MIIMLSVNMELQSDHYRKEKDIKRGFNNVLGTTSYTRAIQNWTVAWHTG